MGGKKPKKGKKPGKKGKKPKKKGKKPKKGKIRIGRFTYTYYIVPGSRWGYIVFHGRRYKFHLRKGGRTVVRIGRRTLKFTLKIVRRPNKNGKKPGKKGKK